MKKTKKIALIVAVIMLMAVCFIFGVSAETWGDYEYTVLEDGTVEIVKYKGDEIDVITPYEIEGKIVSSIGERSFEACREINSITISNGTKYIKDGAFWGCNKVKTVTIPESVEKIGGDTFSGLGLLERFFVDEKNDFYSNDTYGVLYNKSKTELIKYPSSNKATIYFVPNTVLKISESAFYNSLFLKKVVLPEGLMYIEDCAFYGCFELEEIVLPITLKEIGDSCFGLCFCLKELTIPENVIKIGEFAIVYCLFTKTVNIKSISCNIPENSVNVSEYIIEDLSAEECASLYKAYVLTGDESNVDKYYEHAIFKDYIVNLSKIYCHAGSTAETYARENGVNYELTHFFEGEWTYDYENNVRIRKCIHCDELQVEELKIQEISGDNFLLVEETVTNGIEGDIEVLKAFDINLKNGEGVHIQPDGTIKVKLPNDWSKKGVYKVYRVNNDGTLTDMNAYREGSHLVFDTDHFSIYVIVVEGVVDNESETPVDPDATDCNCICHKEGFIFEILTIVFKFVAKITGVFPTCDCGIAHY